MQFKVDDSLKQITGVANKPEVKQKKVEPMLREDEEEPQLDLMKARKGFDLSEMILGR
jgi:threonyl-tRNA synthetase